MADDEGMMSAVSPAWTRVLGWSEAELLSRPYATFMHPEDMEPTLAPLARMGDTGHPSGPRREPHRDRGRSVETDPVDRRLGTGRGELHRHRARRQRGEATRA